MLIGSVDNNISYQNPYVNKVEDQQNQPVSAADKTDDTSKIESSTTAGPLTEPHDEYIPSGDKSKISAGIYKLKQDEAGQKKIVLYRTDSTEKNGEQPEVNPEPSSDNEQPKGVDGTKGSDDKTESKCTTNTDKVDREIKKLKEEKKQIEQELKSNQNDEDKRKELEQQLTQVESELSMKDNDAYRKQNATYTYG